LNPLLNELQQQQVARDASVEPDAAEEALVERVGKHHFRTLENFCKIASQKCVWLAFFLLILEDLLRAIGWGRLGALKFKVSTRIAHDVLVEPVGDHRLAVDRQELQR